MYYGCCDWNIDGKIDIFDLGIENHIIQTITEDVLRKERINKMFVAIQESGYDEIDNNIFWELCQKIGIPMSDFEQDDINILQRMVERAK